MNLRGEHLDHGRTGSPDLAGAGCRTGGHIVREVGVRRLEGALLALVLDGDEDAALGVTDDRSAGFGVAGHGEELLHAAALGASQRDLEQTVSLADAGRGAVGGYPEVPQGVEGQVVRAGNRRDLVSREAGE